MPLTRDQIARQKTEGSLRRQFDHFITNLDDEHLDHLSEHFDAVERMLDAVLKAGVSSRPPVTRPVFENGTWHEKEC